MNLLVSNMRPNFASGMTSKNVSQKLQFHHAASSLDNLIQHNSTPEDTDKHFQNPNIFKQINFEKNVPSSYKHSNHSEEGVQEKNLINSVFILEAKQIDPDSVLIKESSKLPVEINYSNNSETKLESLILNTSEAPLNMDKHSTSSDEQMSCSLSDDSFIEFKIEAGPSDLRRSAEIPILEFMDQDISSDEDDDWNQQTMVFHNSSRNRNRQNSVSESEDSFIVFDGEDQDEDMDVEMGCNDTFIVFADEDFEENIREKKSKSGKKVTFAEGSELCKVHKMIKWSFAYQKARKGLWEQYARDNERFKFRISLFSRTLDRYLLPEHRQKIYDERFKEKQD